MYRLKRMYLEESFHESISGSNIDDTSLRVKKSFTVTEMSDNLLQHGMVYLREVKCLSRTFPRELHSKSPDPYIPFGERLSAQLTMVFKLWLSKPFLISCHPFHQAVWSQAKRTEQRFWQCVGAVYDERYCEEHGCRALEKSLSFGGGSDGLKGLWVNQGRDES
jgi:hypothetical protein